MDFSIKAHDLSQAANQEWVSGKTDCIVVGIFEDQPLGGVAQQLDHASQGMLARLAATGDMAGKSGSTLMLHEVAGVSAARVLAVGLGKAEQFNPSAYIKATHAALLALIATCAAEALWTLTQLPVSGRDAAWAIRMAVQLARAASYRFTQMKSKPDADPLTLRKLILTASADDLKHARSALKQGIALAHGIELTRGLANLPSNVCTPGHLAETARTLAHEWTLKAEILGPKQITALKMGAFLSVAKGSTEPPCFIVLKYNGGAAKQAPVVLVGKGITFDSGGISLKPGEAMDEMKYDMSGAAAVLGTLRAVAEMQLKINVIGVIPTCENMPSGNASKPGDIVTSMSGQTIEVLNTDAEGRLILCDALTYAERFKPAAVIDIATLTGACVIALGHVNSGLFSKSDALAEQLLAAGKIADDTAWRLPLEDEYQEQLKSNFADMANIGGRPAGSVTAACFLARFTEKYEWAHLDIAGTAWKKGKAKGATGRPVALLTQFLLNRAQ